MGVDKFPSDEAPDSLWARERILLPRERVLVRESPAIVPRKNRRTVPINRIEASDRKLVSAEILTLQLLLAFLSAGHGDARHVDEVAGSGDVLLLDSRLRILAVQLHFLRPLLARQILRFLLRLQPKYSRE